MEYYLIFDYSQWIYFSESFERIQWHERSIIYNYVLISQKKKFDTNNIILNVQSLQTKIIILK